MAVLTINNSACGTPTALGYGALYNWNVTQDARLISSDDDFIVPTESIARALFDYIGTEEEGLNYWLLVGGTLKETGLDNWNSPNEGATNEYGFNAVGTGRRSADGTFLYLKDTCEILTDSELGTDDYVWRMYFYSYISDAGLDTEEKQMGSAIRLCNPTTANPDGFVGTYTQNNGVVIHTIVINGVEWTMNLNERKYRNGDWITGFGGGVYTPISNEAWALLETEAMCYYDDDVNNG